MFCDELNTKHNFLEKKIENLKKVRYVIKAFFVRSLVIIIVITIIVFLLLILDILFTCSK